MVYTSKEAELEVVMETARAMCAAARTAPKTKGMDCLDCCILTGEELEDLAQKMEELGKRYDTAFLLRDAANVRTSAAVVLIGTKNVCHGINALCGCCGAADCAACAKTGSACVFSPMDLGIAIGSAVSVAADRRVDNRVMFSIGRAAMELKYLGDASDIVIGIPLSVSGKSPYFTRQPL